MEMQKIPAAGYKIVGLWISGIQRQKWLKNVLLPFKLMVSLWQARKILKAFQPDVVIGTGGYASAAIVYVAARLKIPTLIQEQNAFAGLANKLLAQYVDAICVAHTRMDRYFPAQKIFLTGNPVRDDMVKALPKKIGAMNNFGLNTHKKCLLVLGGSLGAKTINNSVFNARHKFIAADIQLIWQTGSLYFEAIKAGLAAIETQWIKCYPFLDKIHVAYAAADVVVSRAGALAVSELCLAKKPVVFVPSPNVTADHQTKNARALVEKDAAIMIADKWANERLADTALQLLNNEAQQKALALHIGLLAKPRATADIVCKIIDLAHRSM